MVSHAEVHNIGDRGRKCTGRAPRAQGPQQQEVWLQPEKLLEAEAVWQGEGAAPAVGKKPP